MAYQERNIVVSLVSTSLILGYFLIRMAQMLLGGGLQEDQVFRLWGITIVLGIIFTVGGTILTAILTAVIHQVQTNEEPEMIEDERDKFVDLKGTRNTYYFFAVGVFLAMLAFVFGQPPLVMFSLLALAAFISQVFGDLSRLYFYRRGF